MSSTGAAAVDTYVFGAVSQRSTVMTAEYWNPILDHVSRRAGVQLKLKSTRTGSEHDEAIARSEYDFLYGNHFFKPDLMTSGYRVFARPSTAPVAAQIVTLTGSPIRSLDELRGQTVGFPSREAVLGYHMTMDQLLRRGIQVNPVFGGNQEGIMAQLKVGKVVAAGVNGAVMQHFAERERLAYRVLWASPEFYDLPLAAHPRVPATVVAAVRRAFVDMAEDAEGSRILAASARLIGQPPPLGFVEANTRDYQGFVDYYRNAILREGHRHP